MNPGGRSSTVGRIELSRMAISGVEVGVGELVLDGVGVGVVVDVAVGVGVSVGSEVCVGTGVAVGIFVDGGASAVWVLKMPSAICVPVALCSSSVMPHPPKRIGLSAIARKTTLPSFIALSPVH